MKLNLARETILKIEAEVAASESAKDMPHLKGMRNMIYLETEGKVLRIIGSGRDLEIIEDLELPEELPGGKALFGGRKLVDICRTLSEGSEVEMDIGEGWIEAKAGKVGFKLQNVGAEHFQRTSEEGEGRHKFVVATAVLGRLLRKTAPFMPTDDVRYYLNGILLELRPGELRAVSTDGHRLAMCAAAVDKCQPEETIQAIVPSDAVKFFQQWLQGEQAEQELELEISERHLRLKAGARTVITLLIDGKFPDYEKVIPSDMPQEARVPVASMRSAMARVLALRTEGANPRVIWDIKEGHIHSQAENEQGEKVEEDIEIEQRGDGIKIAFNANYIKDIFESMETEKARIDLKEPNGSVLLQEVKEAADTQYVLMPMNL